MSLVKILLSDCQVAGAGAGGWRLSNTPVVWVFWRYRIFAGNGPGFSQSIEVRISKQKIIMCKGLRVWIGNGSVNFFFVSKHQVF